MSAASSSEILSKDLVVAGKVLGIYCSRQNIDWLRCKAEDPTNLPGSCLAQGAQVQACADEVYGLPSSSSSSFLLHFLIHLFFLSFFLCLLQPFSLLFHRLGLLLTKCKPEFSALTLCVNDLNNTNGLDNCRKE